MKSVDIDKQLSTTTSRYFEIVFRCFLYNFVLHCVRDQFLLPFATVLACNKVLMIPIYTNI